MSSAQYVCFSFVFFPGGDGLADIVGRRFGGVKLPWNSNKSWAGSLAMFIGVCFILLGCVVVCPPLGRTEGYSGGFSEDLRRSQCFVIGCPPPPQGVRVVLWWIDDSNHKQGESALSFEPAVNVF